MDIGHHAESPAGVSEKRNAHLAIIAFGGRGKEYLAFFVYFRYAEEHMAKVITDEKKIDELLTRGVQEVIHRDHLRAALLSGKRLRVKLGNDPTSPNIHIGRATLLWKLRAFQDLGHTAVFIVGDFTGIIGDTSDKESERPMLSKSEIKKNVTTYFKQAFKILDPRATETYYNSKWLKKIGLEELGTLTNAFSLHEFEARENIAKRMKAESRVSLREVLYPIMQGYDSVQVKADVEIGGTDQRFNLLAGRTIQALYNQEPQDILMTTLLEGLDGRKMSSSWGNTVNITDAPSDMFGKIMSLQDTLIEKYFRLCTSLSEETIGRVMAMNPRDAKLELAHTIVSMYHGEKEGERAKTEFISVFSSKDKPSDIPEVRVDSSSFSLVELLVKAGFTQSKSEARRLIEQGGVRVNDVRKTDPQEVIHVDNTLIQVGPRRFVRVIANNAN